MLSAVTFDFWNTLFVDVHGRAREELRCAILREELERLGAHPPRAALDEALRAGWDFFDRVWVGERRTPRCGETVAAVLAALGVDLPRDVFARVVTAFERVLLEIPPEPTPGAVSTLTALTGRYRLAVICDTGYSPGTVLRELLERHGMLAHFEYLYFSDEHEHCKPDKRAFTRTLAELGVRAPEAAHVGDIQRTDIAGAQAAGMAAVHFIGANDHDAGESTADIVVRRFDELPAALGNLTCAGC